MSLQTVVFSNEYKMEIHYGAQPLNVSCAMVKPETLSCLVVKRLKKLNVSANSPLRNARVIMKSKVESGTKQRLYVPEIRLKYI